jgi:hypothetical protein
LGHKALQGDRIPTRPVMLNLVQPFQFPRSSQKGKYA